MIPLPLYLQPNHRTIAESAGYNQRELALLDEFADRGYVTIDVPTANFDAVAQEAIQDLEPQYAADGRLQDAWQSSGAVKSIAVDQDILNILKKLYGRDAFPFQTLNFNKGTEQETHSDTIHFDSSPRGYMAGVWVALEDIDVNNGPLHYYPGSHKLDQLTLAHAGVRGSDIEPDAYYKYYEPMIANFVKENGLTKEEGYIRKGQAIIWSANLLHGGSPIRQVGRSRHSQVTHYYFDDCVYFTPLFSDPLLGRTYIRQPVDVRTGLSRPGSYANGPAPKRSAAMMANLARRWVREHLPFSSR